jgi:hypothetical protein
MKTEGRTNVDRDLDVVGFSHGDHQPLTAIITFAVVKRFGGRSGRGSSTLGESLIDGVNATVVVRCPGCCWNARATQYKSADNRDPNAYVKDTTVAKILVQALNNFRSKVPTSCADAMAAFILTS